MSDRRGWQIALGWTLVAVAVRVAWLAWHPPVIAWDGEIYARTAARIARGMGFVDTWNNRPPWRPTAFYPVGYPAMLGLGYALFGVHAWVAGALNVVSAAVSTCLVARFAGRAWGGAGAHLAAALCALSPGAVIYTSAMMTETLSAAVLCGAVACALHHARTGRATSALAAGALLGLGALIRPPALVVAPVLAVVSAHGLSLRAVARAVAWVGVACAAVVLPWTARNCASLDGCALVSVNGGSNLWIGADPTADGGYRDLHPGEGCDGVHGEVGKDRCYSRLAIHRIADAPIAWMALAPAKVRRLFSQETSPVAYLDNAPGGPVFRPDRAREAFAWMTAWHRLLVALAAVVVVARSRREAPRELIVSVACIAALVAVHIVFFSVDRYHFVFTPLLCVLAGGALARRAVPVP